jgi:UDP-N-acetylglucosamine diphosphorylase / glucose-1-phosphate thymidylyltransferase / UDP-N-acetylgalactosamine diphosphorylase / glucosamine-1-phosphate N-acetyltransferase / galactosamine-1-phosphate N-acetyltransferase
VILVIPMAGRGERFRSAGYETPKPLIELSPGVPMFARAAGSFPLELMSEIVFVVLAEHCEAYGIDREIRKHFPNPLVRVLILDDVTSGQAETVALALDPARPDEPLMVFNADSAFDDDLRSWITEQADAYDGALQVFRDTDCRWSFARTDDSGEVVETAEKSPISDLASTGLYYFRSFHNYLAHYAEMKESAGEKYIAPLYNRMIAARQRIGIIPCDRYHCFGTPADFAACQAGKMYRYHHA